MNLFNRLKHNFTRLNIAQQISLGVLVLCVPVLVTLSVSALTASNAYLQTMSQSSEAVSSQSESEVIISSEEESSSEEVSSVDPVEIFLKPSSVEEDLEVQIVDADGNMVTGFDFILTVKAKKTSYTSTWTVNDGFLRLTKLVAGDYTVTISQAEGYIITEDTVECTVKEKVKYEKVDVADKIKDETEIDVSKEDASLTKPVATPEPTPQLPTYENKAASVTTEITAYRYKANNLSKGDFAEDNTGYIHNRDGSKSIYIAKVDENGYIVGDIRVLNVTPSPSVSDSTAAAAEFLTGLSDILSSHYSVFNVRGNAFLTFMPLTVADSVMTADDDSASGTVSAPESSSQENSSSSAEICTDCGQVKTESCSAAYCTVCASHAGHTASDVHCSSCGRYGHADNSSSSCSNYTAPDSSSEESSSSVETPSSSDSSSESSSASDSNSSSDSSSASQESSSDSGSSSDGSSSDTSGSQNSKPSYDSAVKADIYDKNSVKIADSILKTLDITEAHETKKVYKGGWNEDKTSYYLADGSMVKGQVIIGGNTYNFDSDGVVVKNVAKGIDVSKYQPKVDWAKVKASGVDYVIIRVGYRGYGSGVMVEDPYFKSHIAGARAAGLKVGVYFYSQAITVEEAVEEASMAIQLCNNYKLHYPIYFDTEATGTGVGRADKLSKTQRTAIANAFCQTVRNSGYKAGVYASKSWFYYQLDYSQLAQYDIWLAHYAASTDFSHRYDMWQYTGTGSCPGVSGAVDLNWAYKIY